MSFVVLDASAGAEIVVGTANGRRLFALAPRDNEWWVPDLSHVEAAGAIRRMLLQGQIDEARSSLALERLLGLPARMAHSRPLVAEAWTLRHNLIVHDAVYVVLDRHLGAPLPTDDRRIAGAPNPSVEVLHLSG